MKTIYAIVLLTVLFTSGCAANYVNIDNSSRGGVGIDQGSSCETKVIMSGEGVQTFTLCGAAKDAAKIEVGE